MLHGLGLERERIGHAQTGSRALMAHDGIGSRAATAFVAELDDARHFSSWRQAVAILLHGDKREATHHAPFLALPRIGEEERVLSQGWARSGTTIHAASRNRDFSAGASVTMSPSTTPVAER